MLVYLLNIACLFSISSYYMYKRTTSEAKGEVVLFCFVLILVKRPGKQFFSRVETEPPIPGYYQYFWGVNVSCSRKQHTDPAEDRTRVSRSGVRRSG